MNNHSNKYKFNNIFSVLGNSRIKDIIKPYLSNYEKRLVLNSVFKRIERMSGNYEFSTKDGKQMDISELLDSIPSDLITDMFNSYYAGDEDREFDMSKDPDKYRLISKTCDFSMGIVTGNNPLSSLIFSSNTLDLIIKNIIEEIEDNPSKGQSALDGLTGSDKSEDKEALQSLINRMSDSGEFQKIQAESMKEAEKVKDIQDMLKEGDPNNESNPGTGSFDQDLSFDEEYEKMEYMLNALKFSSQHNKFFNAIMNSNYGNFASDIKNRYVPLEDAEDPFNNVILGLEHLYSPMFVLNMEDIVVLEQSRTGTLDIVIDCSGSMHGAKVHGSNEEHVNNIDRFTLAKALAYKFMKKGYTNKVYFFDSYVHGPYKTPYELITFHKSGGTSFSRVVEEMINNNKDRKVFIITDGQDYVDFPYDPNIYWCGIDTTVDFEEFKQGSEEKYKYVENNRCGYYDPSTGQIVMTK